MPFWQLNVMHTINVVQSDLPIAPANANSGLYSPLDGSMSPQKWSYSCTTTKKWKKETLRGPIIILAIETDGHYVCCNLGAANCSSECHVRSLTFVLMVQLQKWKINNPSWTDYRVLDGAPLFENLRLSEKMIVPIEGLRQTPFQKHSWKRYFIN